MRQWTPRFLGTKNDVEGARSIDFGARHHRETHDTQASAKDLSRSMPMIAVQIEYLLCAIAIAIAGIALYRWRTSYRHARSTAVLGERARIARELHDTLAQGLAGVGIQIETAMRKSSEQPEIARKHLELAQAMVRSSLAEVRRSIWMLRTRTSTEPGGLGTALLESLAQLTESTGIVPKMTVAGRPRVLDPDVERNLLRVAHEAVTNAVRHAAARTIQVDLSFDNEALSLRVRDDGRGFDPHAPLDHSGGNHLGLMGITERAQAMGGELRLSSRLGEGTEVLCRLPYHCRNVDPFEQGASL
jgi:signal transduction histidine kinase